MCRHEKVSQSFSRLSGLLDLMMSGTLFVFMVGKGMSDTKRKVDNSHHSFCSIEILRMDLLEFLIYDDCWCDTLTINNNDLKQSQKNIDTIFSLYSSYHFNYKLYWIKVFILL